MKISGPAFTCTTDCFSIKIYNTTFNKFNFYANVQTYTTFVSEEYGLAYRALILDLKEFNG